MAVTATAYGLTFSGQYSATAARRIDWVTDTIKVALVTSTYSPAQDTDTFWGDSGISSNELATGNGYTTGGQAIPATKSVAYDTTTNETRLKTTGTNSWTFTGTKAFRYAVVYKDTGTTTTSPLMCWEDLGAQSITDSTFTITWDTTNGILKIAAA
jgi:hypothetical protein